MENLDHLARRLAGPVSADAIEAAIQADLRAVTFTGGAPRPVARPSVLTLIAVALDQAGTRRILDAIDHLARLHPSRTLVLLPDYPVGGDDLQIWHDPVCYGGAVEGALVCGDKILIAARGHAVHHLASLADQLQLPGLPVFLWWDADLAAASGDLFARLTDLAGRLIVDSSTFRTLGAATGRLAWLARRRHNPCIPSDLNWARLGPWREVLAQLFDLPATRSDLEEIGALTVAYDPADPTGPAQALLFVAWLAARLGWRPEPGPRLDLPGAPGQSLPSRLRREGGIVALGLGEPTDRQTASGCGLAGVEVTSARGAAVRVTRSEDCLRGVVESGPIGTASMLHQVAFDVLDPGELLGRELMIYGRDHVYEDTLALAADLVQGR